MARLTPALILGFPLFDIAFISVARGLSGKVRTVQEWLVYTGKDHIHHRFEALGLKKSETVLLLYLISATLGLSAMRLEKATRQQAFLLLVQAACVLAIIAMLESVGRGRTG